ncbi:hypothetical protein BGAL_1050g00020 [Botrytis galanthina]|uniref:Uncharacterized protein n=1 Tax=Botrytis galanthina TaxID=278940 RepID=A0A4S8QG43_9HELO|nr:hypothetical protein BGAL_1050g00020 [Botrytis galanthina]
MPHEMPSTTYVSLVESFYPILNLDFPKLTRISAAKYIMSNPFKCKNYGLIYRFNQPPSRKREDQPHPLRSLSRVPIATGIFDYSIDRELKVASALGEFFFCTWGGAPNEWQLSVPNYHPYAPFHYRQDTNWNDLVGSAQQVTASTTIFATFIFSCPCLIIVVKNTTDIMETTAAGYAARHDDMHGDKRQKYPRHRIKA